MPATVTREPFAHVALDVLRDGFLLAFSITLLVTWLSASSSVAWVTEVRMTAWFGPAEACADFVVFALGAALGVLGLISAGSPKTTPPRGSDALQPAAHAS